MDLSVSSEFAMQESQTQNPIAQYIVIQDKEAKLWRQGSHIRVPVKGRGDLFAVSCGLPGVNSSALASQIGIRAILGFYENSQHSGKKLQLGGFILDAHRKLLKKAKLDEITPLGTSFSIAWIINDTCFWAHVGNTKLYRLREGHLKQISTDQNFAEFARRDGLPEPENPNGLAQAFLLGKTADETDDSLRLDLGLDVHHFKLKPNDRLLLCTAEMAEQLDDSEMIDGLNGNPRQSAISLFEKSIRNANEDRLAVVSISLE